LSLSDTELTLVQDMEEVEAFLRWLSERRPVLALDIETSGLSLAKDHIRMVQFGDARRGWAIPYRDWRGVVKHALDRYEGKLVLQHAKFDAGFLTRDGLSFPWERVHDTMMMSFLYDSVGPKSLKKAAAAYIDPLAGLGERELKKAMVKNRWGYGDIPVDFDIYWGYSALDTVLTAQLAEFLWPQVQYARAAYDLELACERVLCDMEGRGLAIDVAYCQQQQEEIGSVLGKVESTLGFSPYSSAEVRDALLASGAKLTKRTESGAFSTDDEVLKKLAAEDNIVAARVIEARMFHKLLTSYFDNLLEFNTGGIIHPHINQLAARTGRMSVTEPALQTIPRKALVRDAFIPRPGHSLLLIDYAAQELRVAAHIGQDEKMLDLFRRGVSPHEETARSLYGEQFSKGQRTTAKNAMFSFTYGAGAPKFARTAGVPLHEAEAVFRTLRQLYPGLSRAMTQVEGTVRERANGSQYGYVLAVHDGRRLRVRSDKAYQGLNTLIQGSCAVVLKQALVDLDASGLGEFLVLPIHDEIMFDVPNDQLEEVIPTAMEVMRRDDFSAPLEVEHQVVQRWGDPYR